jgi:malate dehydrogenase (quinone)
MFDVMKRCFKDRYPAWEPKLKEMVPSLGHKLSEDPKLFAEVWAYGNKVLGLGSGADAALAAKSAGPDRTETNSSGEPEPAGVV